MCGSLMAHSRSLIKWKDPPNKYFEQILHQSKNQADADLFFQIKKKNSQSNIMLYTIF